jgi:PAS domain S-box-containing protein
MTSTFGSGDERIDPVGRSLERLGRELEEKAYLTLRARDFSTPGSAIPDPMAIREALASGDGSGSTWKAGGREQAVQVLERIPRPVHLFDEKGIIRYTNAGFDRMFGYPRGGLLGKHLAILNWFSIEENVRMMAEIMVKASSHGYWQGDLSFRRRDDVPFTVSVFVQPLELSGVRFWVAVHGPARFQGATPERGAGQRVVVA